MLYNRTIVHALTNRFRLMTGIPPALRSNFTHLFFDIGWWALYAGATAAFLNVYAVRVGATPAQIGLLSALPSAIALAISLPLGRIMRGIPAMRATFWSGLTGRALLVLYVFVPWLAVGIQIDAILVIAVIATLPNAVIGISFSEFIMEAVPPEWRGMVVSGRIAIYAIVSFTVTLLSGWILTRLPFPLGYQVVFFIGFVGGSMTAIHIARVKRVVEPGGISAPGIQALAGSRCLPGKLSLPSKLRLPSKLWLPGKLRMPNIRQLFPPIDAQGRRYLRVIGLLFLFNTVNSMVAPLAPEVLVNRLRLSDSTISVGTALANMLLFLVSLFITRITRRLGNRNATALGAALVAGHAVALGLAQGPAAYYIAAFIGGVGSGVLGTAQYTYHLENVPDAERTTWLSWNLLFANAAVLLGSLGGPGIAGLAGIPFTLLLLGVLRLVMGLVIFKWG
jgi:hypothetical protein